MRYSSERYNIICSLIPQAGSQFAKKAIDVGCGEGVFTKMLWGKGYESLGIDINEEKIAVARKQFGDSRLRFEIGDANKIKLPSKSIDLVLSLELIEHLEDTQLLLSEIRRVLKTGGLLVISTPNRCSLEGLGGRILAKLRRGRWNAWDDTHKTIFSSSEFMRLLRQKGFEPIKVIGYYYFVSVYPFKSLPCLVRLQESFGFIRFTHSTRCLLNKIGFDTICVCALKDNRILER